MRCVARPFQALVVVDLLGPARDAFGPAQRDDRDAVGIADDDVAWADADPADRHRDQQVSWAVLVGEGCQLSDTSCDLR